MLTVPEKLVSNEKQTTFEKNMTSFYDSSKEEKQLVAKLDDTFPKKKAEDDAVKLDANLGKEKVETKSDKVEEVNIKDDKKPKDIQEYIKEDAAKVVQEKKEENKVQKEEQKSKAEFKDIPASKPEKLLSSVVEAKFHINEKKFYGEKSISSVSSKGSVFQENFHNFFTGNKPLKGASAIEIQKQNIDEDYIKPKSLLQKMKQQNYNNDPKYGKNEAIFFNSEDKLEKPKMTYAEKLDKFVSKI